MAKYRGTIQGNGRDAVARLGTKNSGIRCSVATHHESVFTKIWWDEPEQVNMLLITYTPVQGLTTTLYYGRLEDADGVQQKK